ncbi:polysaccharide biosynthesis/export family protein [Methylosinus sp. Sm6]|uniref:polysaccharide biosynthesis/export family protein n=1 Tax=Methylosinus sp. Sm6 TaxID=2866948 RepID=UPI001C990C61|nr:polysaccharide biosynthesis/export family protein [Methylosinus sp. Sm6]MBY6242484.1 polysaccharide export protein [Methylosinus sp. Sm6]
MAKGARRRHVLATSCIVLALGGCSESVGSFNDETGSFARDRAYAPAAQSKIPLSNPSDADYKIQPLDVLEITVFQVKELDGTRQVSSTGHVSMPLIGELQAKGKSVKELETAIAARLGSNYLHSPDVHVSVKDYLSQRFTVEGSVTSPGVYPITGRMTLLQAIAQAKGLTRSADRDVAVFRTVDNARVANRYDLSAIRSGEREDPVLVAGDIVVVGESAIRSAWTEFKDLFGVGIQGVGVAARFVP